MRGRRVRAGAMALWMGCALTAACGGSGGSSESQAEELRVVRGSELVSATVDRSGLRMELEQGAAATFERDAVREPTDVELQLLEERAVRELPDDTTRLLGRPVVLRPLDLEVEVPVRLELPLRNVEDVPPSRVRVFRAESEEPERWDEVDLRGLDVAGADQPLARIEVERGGVYVAAELAASDSPSQLALPSVEAGEDGEVDEGARLELLGRVDDDDEGSVTSAWQQTAGPSVTLDDADTLSPSFTAPDVSRDTLLTFELTATNTDGAQASDSVSVLVRFVNTPPTADAGDDQRVSEGAAVALSGSGSDSEGGITAAWTQLAGPETTLNGADTLVPTFSAPAVGSDTELTFELTVTDLDGASASDTVRVVVEAIPNQLPVVSAGADQIAPEQTTVTLDGVASDGDGSIASLTWTQIGGGVTVGLTSLDADSVQFDGPAVTQATPLVFELTAVDDEGGTRSDSVLVTLTPVNLAPLVDAGAPQSVTEDTAGALEGVASDSDGDLGNATITWRQLSGSPATIADPSALITSFAPPDIGAPEVLVFELEVIDDEGASARDTVVFNVLPIEQGNVPPQVYAGPDLVVASGMVSLENATASDSDGTVTSIAWTQITGTPVTGLTGQTTLTPSFDVSAVTCGETLVFELEVQDDQGAVATDRVGVLVNADYDSPVALGSRFDFESDDGGFTTDGMLWELDVPTSGPNVAHSGNRVWASNAAGNYPDAAFETLCLPTLDREGQARVTLSFYLWSSFSGGDGVRVEALDPALGWQPITQVSPGYADSNLPAWQAAGRNSLYALHTVRIPASASGRPKLRFVLESNASFNSAGAYIDDVAVHSETDDPDGDGLPGIEDEWLVYGTDPFSDDTDGDGVLDGAEVAAGTDPLNPATFEGADPLTPPFVLDFDADDGGLVAIDTQESPGGNLLWQHGVPSTGPNAAHSPSQAWATHLAGNYGDNERAFLYLPVLDLSDTTEPTLSFRLWASCSANDGMRVEAYDVDTSTWVGLTPAFPAYDTSDALGNPAFGNVNRQGLYSLVAYALNAYAGEPLQVRLAFRSNANFTGAGVYVDDLAVHDESDDPDGDGIAGILGEHGSYGTDPFASDTDGDGASDGQEVASDATDPLDPSDYASGPVLTVPSQIDFETDDGGFTTTTTVGSSTQPDDLWQYGAAASGPLAGHAGSVVWATNLSGNYGDSEIAYLNVPPIDLTTASDPTLSFRLWSQMAGNDGVSVEVYDPDTSRWLTAPVAFPAYNATDAAGNAAWGTLARGNLYSLVAVSLQPYVGTVARVRFAFRSNLNFTSAGAYIDEVALHEESDDPDADGIPGVIDERLAYGTDPFVQDTDGDGVGDGTEAVADGTDPLDPAYYAGGRVLVPGELLDFEAGGGGLAALQPSVDGDWLPDTLWARGTPGSSGPNGAYSGSSVWATRPTGNYSDDARAFLYVPPIDLTGVSDASLSMRLWGRVASGDGLSLEVLDGDGTWSQLTPLTPAYDGTDAAGGDVPCWATVGYRREWALVVVPLTGLGDQLVRVRLVFRSNANFNSYGFAVDDLAVHDESVADPDGDTLVGVADELQTYGTDPLVADTDGDGFDDGTEDAAGTDPLNPGDDPDAVPITAASGVLDLEVHDHDFASDGALWSYGSVASGPGAGASGTRAFATHLAGNYFDEAREYLYTPPVVVDSGADATFGFHLWMQTSANDGLSLEIWDAAAGWQKLPAAAAPYQAVDASGTTSWRTFDSGYVFGAVSLAPWAGETVLLRFAFRSNASFNGAGAYLDDFILLDENGSDDPDGDGLPGLLNEYLGSGTDPLVADTDGDGVDDASDAEPLNDAVQ